MLFQRRFHERIRSGDITCTVRIWQRPHVKVGGRYALAPGAIVVDEVHETRLDDITAALARRSGFPDEPTGSSETEQTATARGSLYPAS